MPTQQTTTTGQNSNRPLCRVPTFPRPREARFASTKPNSPQNHRSDAHKLRNSGARVAAEERLDGKFLLSTSDPDISAEDVALGYKNLLEAERSFRDLKGILRLRPVFHRLEERVRAHILICWLALLLVRLCEQQTSQTWRNLRRELERLHLVTLAGAAGQLQQTTRPTPEQRDILAQLQIEPPPRLTSLTPA